VKNSNLYLSTWRVSWQNENFSSVTTISWPPPFAISWYHSWRISQDIPGVAKWLAGSHNLFRQ
jgi:hypothetical protein